MKMVLWVVFVSVKTVLKKDNMTIDPNNFNPTKSVMTRKSISHNEDIDVIGYKGKSVLETGYIFGYFNPFATDEERLEEEYQFYLEYEENKYIINPTDIQCQIMYMVKYKPMLR